MPAMRVARGCLFAVLLVVAVEASASAAVSNATSDQADRI